MANSYSWSVKCLYTKDITESGSTYADVIKKATVYLKATDSGGDSAETGIDMDFNNPADWSKFTAYGSVTEANVIAWTEARLGNDTLTEEEFQQALAKGLIGEPIKMEGIDADEEKNGLTVKTEKYSNKL